MRVDVVNVNILSQRIGELASISHGGNLKRSSVELTKDLWEWGHLTPFEFQVWIFKIEAPIFVARQVMRYRTGAFIEKSLRYTKPMSKMYILDSELYGSKIKEENVTKVIDIIEHAYEQISKAYDELVEIAPKELARVVVPLGAYTEFVWKIDSRNLYHFLEQRLSEHAQPATRNLAKMILNKIRDVDMLLYNIYTESLKKDGINIKSSESELPI